MIKKRNFAERLVIWARGNYKYEERSPQTGLAWLSEVRPRIESSSEQVFSLLSPDADWGFSPKKLARIFKIASENEEAAEAPSDEEVLKLHRSAFFKDEKTLALLNEGITRMRMSIDPAHDWAHVRRVLQFSDLLWQALPYKERPDWGAVVLSCVWHDVARVDWLGPAEDGRTWLKKIPGGQDFSIIYTAIKDAAKSAVLLERAARRLGIDPKLKRLLMQGVRSTKNTTGTKNARQSKKRNLLSQILCDSDALDLLTIGRLEGFLSNSRAEQIVDNQYRDRFILILFCFRLPFWGSNIVFEESKHLQKVLQAMTHSYLKRFHKKESALFEEAVGR